MARSPLSPSPTNPPKGVTWLFFSVKLGEAETIEFTLQVSEREHRDNLLKETTKFKGKQNHDI